MPEVLPARSPSLSRLEPGDRARTQDVPGARALRLVSEVGERPRCGVARKIVQAADAERGHPALRAAASRSTSRPPSPMEPMKPMENDMTRETLRSRVLVAVLALTRLLILPLACGALAAQEPPTPRQDMIQTLAARGPTPALAAEARLFDRFVGTWDCDYAFFGNDGRVTHAAGELRFGWILDGKALQDVWIAYPSEPGRERSIGTSIRFFDAK